MDITANLIEEICYVFCCEPTWQGIRAVLGVFIISPASRCDAGRGSDRDGVVVVDAQRLKTLTLSFQHVSKRLMHDDNKNNVKWLRSLLQVSKKTVVLLLPSSTETVKKKSTFNNSICKWPIIIKLVIFTSQS